MFHTKELLVISSLLLFVSCVPNKQSSLSPLMNQQKSHTLSEFQTNLDNFINSPFHQEVTKEERDAFIKEFLFQSNMQCQHHLTQTPLSQKENLDEQNLYLTIFDTVSTIFGVSHLTESAKRALIPNTQESDGYQQKYQDALTPEILKGVEIGRIRYAKEVLKRATKPLDKYPMEMVKKDMRTYDRQCNREYGLIEINRALMSLKQNLQTPQESIVPQPKQVKIDPIVVKKKVEEVTKEVERKEGRKKEKKREMEKIK